MDRWKAQTLFFMPVQFGVQPICICTEHYMTSYGTWAQSDSSPGGKQLGGGGGVQSGQVPTPLLVHDGWQTPVLTFLELL